MSDYISTPVEFDRLTNQVMRYNLMLLPLCRCDRSPENNDGPDQGCPLHGDGETFTLRVAELEKIESAAREVVDRYRQLLNRDLYKVIDDLDEFLVHLLTKLCIAVDPPVEDSHG